MTLPRIKGLRSHDERLVEQLASRALTSGQRKIHVQRDEDGQIVGAGGKGNGEDQEQDNTDAAAESALLHFSSPRDAATIAAFLRTRVYRPESLVWLEGYQALLRRWTQNEITGVYAVPYDVEVEVGVTKDFPLGRWVHQQWSPGGQAVRGARPLHRRPGLGRSDRDEALNAIRADENLAVVFLADRTTMQAESHALLAVTTLTRKDCLDDEDYEQLTEFGREFRTVPAGVHDVHSNLDIGNLGFEEYAGWAHDDPERIYRSF